MATHTQLLIDGEWTGGTGNTTFETLDPATGEVLGTAVEATAADVDAAVQAAGRAFRDPAWAGMTPAARARLLWRIADLIEQNAAELGELESRDQGQSVAFAKGSMAGAAEMLRYFAGWCTKITGATSPVSIPGMLHYTRREPVGVCALITPWNFPLTIAVWKLAPALAAGNTVMLKPAEQTPLSTARLAQLCVEAGVPGGVVNLVSGGPKVGRQLVEHSGVDKVSFTGSTEVGRSIVSASAGNLKRVSLELGGKAPSIVMADADIDAAVSGNLLGRAGQQRAGVRGVQPFLRRPQPRRRVHREAVRRDVGHQDGTRPGGRHPARPAGLRGAPRTGRGLRRLRRRAGR